MTDQATRLRGLMQTRTRTPDVLIAPNAEGCAKVIAVTSGKGGVGKSTIALNLAVALQQRDCRVCLIDANPGLANIDLLCGLNGYWNLTHVVSGARRLRDVLMEGPLGVKVLSGAGDSVRQLGRDTLQEFRELETEFDLLIIDTGSGLHAGTRAFVAAADIGLVLTTPEPTAIADAYANIKSLSAGSPTRTIAVVNQVASPGQANTILDRLRQTARTFLSSDVINGGSIPLDPALPKSVLQRTPLLVTNPHSPAAEAIVKLAQRAHNLADNVAARGDYFERLSPERLSAAA